MGLVLSVSSCHGDSSDGTFALTWSANSWQGLQADNTRPQDFTRSITMLISGKMKGVLSRPFELSFGASGGDDGFKPIVWGNCTNTEAQVTRQGSNAERSRVVSPAENMKSYAPENLAKLAGLTDADLFGYGIRYRKIILNPDLKAVFTEDALHPRPSCYHGADFNLVTAAVINALARAYDLMLATDTEFKQQLKSLCPLSDDYHERIQQFDDSDFCRQLHGANRLVSDRSPFMHQLKFFFDMGGARSKQRDDQSDLALFDQGDPRLTEDPSSAFAAVVEDAALDPNYYCVHPGIWNFLNQHFETHLTPPTCRQPFSASLYMRPGKRTVIDPSRIYRIDYMYVHPGSDGLIEALGHAMLRVVVCAPDHAVGPDCLNDVDSHYILTFYAEGADTMVEGMTGKGVAKLFVYDYLRMMKGYLVDEKRPIDVIPLKLTQDEVATLLGTAWEWNLRYRGRWYDITNNCVTQTSDLLRASIPRLEYVRFPDLIPATLADALESSPLGTPRSTMTQMP